MIESDRAPAIAARIGSLPRDRLALLVLAVVLAALAGALWVRGAYAGAATVALGSLLTTLFVRVLP